MQGDAVAFGVNDDNAIAVRAEGVLGLEHFAAASLDYILFLHRPSRLPVLILSCAPI